MSVSAASTLILNTPPSPFAIVSKKPFYILLYVQCDPDINQMRGMSGVGNKAEKIGPVQVRGT